VAQIAQLTVSAGREPLDGGKEKPQTIHWQRDVPPQKGRYFYTKALS